jgi:signal transduction histidine kinase
MTAEEDTARDEATRARVAKAVAETLEENLEEIFARYEKKLEEEANLLAAGDGEAREVLRDQAFSLLTRTASEFRGEKSVVSGLEAEMLQNSEAARMPLIQHPDESFRAGAALCAVALETLLEEDALHGESPENVVRVSLTLHGVVMDHVARVVMGSYVDYLLTKIEEIQTEERRRFSRDLHDHVAHSMALVKQNLELFSVMRDKDETAAEEKLENAFTNSIKAIQIARDMSMELRLLETGDSLELALNNLVRASVPPESTVEVEVSGSEKDLPVSVRDQLYMTLREGLRNAVSHSNGKKIRLEVEISAGEVVAAVEDWGDGFDVDAAGFEGVGLRSMRERARLMRGSFEITSEPGEGTRSEVRVPLGK